MIPNTVEVLLRNQLAAVLIAQHGVQSMLRTAQTAPPADYQEVQAPSMQDEYSRVLQALHPNLAFWEKRPVQEGHWLLNDGKMTGNVKLHEDSAKKAFRALNLPVHESQNTYLLMDQAQAIRVRYVKNSMALDFVHKPTDAQLAQMIAKAAQFEAKGGNVTWSIYKPGGLDSNGFPQLLAKGEGLDELSEIDWGSIYR